MDTASCLSLALTVENEQTATADADVVLSRNIIIIACRYLMQIRWIWQYP